MINSLKYLQVLLFVFMLFIDTLLLAQDQEIDLGSNTEEFLFDIDEVELEGPKLLKPEFHGFASINVPFSQGLDEKESSRISDQIELVLWFGTRIFKNLSFDTEVEFENAFEKAEVEKFKLDWNIYGEKLVFKIGKFYYPFGIERFVTHAPSNKLISRPSPSKKIIPGTYSDVGVELYGEIPLLNNKMEFVYELALTNGLKGIGGRGKQEFVDDNNDNKALGGRLGFEIMECFEIGGSYSSGKYDDDEKYKIDFVGADISFEKWGFEMRGEYIRSNVERSTEMGGDYDRYGYYFQASYTYSPKRNYLNYIEGVVRFDSVDPNDLETNDEDVDRVAIGVNYSPMDYARIKFEYDLENEATETSEHKGFVQIVFSW
ncbi:MAG: porin [bacterium]